MKELKQHIALALSLGTAGFLFLAGLHCAIEKSKKEVQAWDQKHSACLLAQKDKGKGMLEAREYCEIKDRDPQP